MLAHSRLFFSCNVDTFIIALGGANGQKKSGVNCSALFLFFKNLLFLFLKNEKSALIDTLWMSVRFSEGNDGNFPSFERTLSEPVRASPLTHQRIAILWNPALTFSPSDIGFLSSAFVCFLVDRIELEW